MDEHVDFTREPIIETVITPKEGFKLVVRSSKSNGQEEHFVDAVEMVSFGYSFFFRSQERPKTFLVPATDYEILEVREARMVLKNIGLDRTIKIAGGREAQMRGHREPQNEKVESYVEEPVLSVSEESLDSSSSQDKSQDNRLDKKRDRRRNNRRRRGKEGVVGDEAQEIDQNIGSLEQHEFKKPSNKVDSTVAQQVLTTSVLTALLAPPPTLISDSIALYKDKYKEAFYTKEDFKQETKTEETALDGSNIFLSQPEYGSYELSVEEEEAIYKQRKIQLENELHRDESKKEDHSKKMPQEHYLGDFPASHD